MKIYQKNLTEMKQIVDDYTSATVAPQIVATVAEIIQTSAKKATPPSAITAPSLIRSTLKSLRSHKPNWRRPTKPCRQTSRTPWPPLRPTSLAFTNKKLRTALPI